MKKNSQFFILIVLLCLLLSLLAVIFLIVPHVSTLKNLSQKVAAKEQELTLGREKVQAIRNASILIKSAQRDIQLLGVAIPEKEKADEALVQVTSAASSAGISVQSAVISPSVNSAVSLTVSASGSYENTVSFIANLEKNLRPVKISDYSLASSSSGQISSTFTISFPYLSAQPSPTATTGTTPTDSQNSTSEKGQNE